jgi:rare lipoprotein A
LGEIRQRNRDAGQALAVLLIIALALSGCTTLKPREPAYQEQGMASWYGPGFHGKTTSNREIYDMHDMTAAHRTLPFGTHVMVTNLENGRSVTVRINDRGPFVKDRIIDLSYAAARQLDMLGPGVVKVRAEVLPHVSPDPAEQKFSVQVGSFTVKSNASALSNSLKERYAGVYISTFRTSRQTYYRVRIKARSMEEARSTARKLQAEGYAVMTLEEQ